MIYQKFDTDISKISIFPAAIGCDIFDIGPIEAALVPSKFQMLCYFLDRRLADGNVHSAGSATYQICFRLSIPNPNPNLKP